MDGKRNIGLDVIRSLAIWMVMIAHGIELLTQTHGPVAQAVFFASAFMGVELFFALSGFLIGGILVDIFDRGITTDLIRRFMVRRWMRTLPLYFFTVALRVVTSPYSLAILPLYLVFLQNLLPGITEIQFFPHSWSLTIEEWSYLCLAVLMLAFARTQRALIYAVTVLIVFSFVARGIAVTGDHSVGVVRQTLLWRLDAICYGVLAALAYRRAGAQIAARAGALFWCSALALAVHIVILAGWGRDYGAFLAIIIVATFSISALLMFPAAIEMRLRPVILRLVFLWSRRLAYALYLFHLFVLVALRDFAGGLALWQAVAVYVASTYLLALIAHFVIEWPFMVLRPAQYGDRKIEDEDC
jgi:peptidoglycan/LPS O-acetylase OafA/YrhL